MMRRFILAFLPFLALGMVSCQQTVSKQTAKVTNTYPHDSEAFTQGLLYFDGKLYESTGLNGRSSLREVNLETGEVIRSLPLADVYFGEGLARLNDKLIQITWRNGDAFLYDLDTFNEEKGFRYETEGWGICFDGTDLYMTDGSSTLYKRSAETFDILKEISVRSEGAAVTRLNELECVDDFIYANIWQTDTIVKIDKSSGNVVTNIDASALLTENEKEALVSDAVLNGIAYNEQTQTFYLTGKLWPKVFEVKFE